MTFEKPNLETGHPLPPPRGSVDRRRVKRPSPWYAFLNDMPVATTSFTIAWPKIHAVRNAAKAMGIEIEYRDADNRADNGLRLVRVWRRT